MPKQEVFLPKKKPTSTDRKIEFRTIPKVVIDHTIRLPCGAKQHKKPFSYDNNNINKNNSINFKPDYAAPQIIPAKSDSFFKSV